MVCKLLANSSWNKCAYVWMGLRTCAAPSTNDSHTIRCKLKFVDFLRKHRELEAPGVLRSPQVRGKLINRVPLTRSCIQGFKEILIAGNILFRCADFSKRYCWVISAAIYRYSCFLVQCESPLRLMSFIIFHKEWPEISNSRLTLSAC